MRALFHTGLVALLLLPALSVGGCDSSDADPAIGGTYRAQQTLDGIVVAFRITIPTTTAGTFAFTGDVRVDGGYVDNFSGTGTYAYPSVTLSESGEALTGTVSTDGSRLSFTDPESGLPLVFTR